MEEFTTQVAAAMEKRGFEVRLAESAEEACQTVLSLIAPGQSVGVGGSMTIRELGVIDALSARGCPVYWHWSSPEEREATLEKARTADVYLASSNAVTRSGQIVNIDGAANRVAGMIQGPKTVVLVIGQQKLVDGGLNAAIARIKQQACPANARRLGLDTPCARTGLCSPLECGDDCMCRVTTMLEHPTRGRRVIVVLVGEAIGY